MSALLLAIAGALGGAAALAGLLQRAESAVAPAVRHDEQRPVALRALDDLLAHAVVQVVVHLLDELVVGEAGEVDVLVVVGHREVGSGLRVRVSAAVGSAGGSTMWNRAV